MLLLLFQRKDGKLFVNISSFVFFFFVVVVLIGGLGHWTILLPAPVASYSPHPLLFSSFYTLDHPLNPFHYPFGLVYILFWDSGVVCFVPCERQLCLFFVFYGVCLFSSPLSWSFLLSDSISTHTHTQHTLHRTDRTHSLSFIDQLIFVAYLEILLFLRYLPH